MAEPHSPSSATLAASPQESIDFTVFTGAMELAEYSATDELINLVGKPELQTRLAELPRPLVHMVGSSTERDLQGDRMTVTALQDMTQCDPNLTIFLNHDYTLPDSVFGSLQGQPSIVMSGGIADLHFTADVEIINPNALQTWLYVQRGRRMGVSGGFMVTGYQWVDPLSEEPVDEDDLDFWDIIEGKVVVDITHVKMVEQSVVGVPANQRSWVEYAIKGLFTRTHNPKLAPVVRSLWPEKWRNLLAGVESRELTQTLAETLPRKTKSVPRLFWLPETRSFVLESGTRQRQVPRSQVKDLLASITPSANRTAAPAVPITTPDGLKGASMNDDTGSTPDIIKGATGKSDWPLADRDRAWDGGAAHKRLLEWAGGKEDLDKAKFRSVHFWSPEGDAAENVSDYKLAFCDVIGGEVKAVPRGIFACAGAHGVDAADIPQADKEKVRGRIEGYYRRMAKEFDDDTIVVPWADEKSLPDGFAIVKAEDGDVAVSADGRHAPFTGEHTHRHKAMGSQGNDETHEHTHRHNGDARHDHAHEKAAGDIAQKGEGDGVSIQVPEGIPDQATDQRPDQTKAGDGSVIILEDGTHAPFTGTHTHDHQDGHGGHHAHEHAHHGDADHGHSHDDLREEKALDAHTLALLKAYNDLGAALGFAAVDGKGMRADGIVMKGLLKDDDDSQEVITLVSQIDTMTDTLCDALAEVSPWQLDSRVDRLMQLLGIPDIDDDGASDDDDSDTPPPAATISGGPIYSSRSAHRLARKAGKRHSQTDLDLIQSIHDACMSLTDGRCCENAAASAAEDQTSADDDAAGDQMQDVRDTLAGSKETKAQLGELTAAVSMLTKAMSGLGIAALMEQVQLVEHALASASAEQQQLAAQTTALAEQVGELAHVPLGRPTRLARAMTGAPTKALDESGAITTDQLMTLLSASTSADDDLSPEQRLARAYERTTKQYVQGVGLCRHWPAGVGKGIRPELSKEQRVAVMGLPDGVSHIMRYEEGGDALIPIIGHDD